MYAVAGVSRWVAKFPDSLHNSSAWETLIGLLSADKNKIFTQSRLVPLNETSENVHTQIHLSYRYVIYLVLKFTKSKFGMPPPPPPRQSQASSVTRPVSSGQRVSLREFATYSHRFSFLLRHFVADTYW